MHMSMTTIKVEVFPYLQERKGACSSRRSNARTAVAIIMTATLASWDKRKQQKPK